MRTSFIMALLAATAIVPTAVFAQDWHRGDGGRGGRGGGGGGQQHQQAPAPQAQTPQSQPAPAPAPARTFDRGNSQGGRGNWQERGQVQAQQPQIQQPQIQQQAPQRVQPNPNAQSWRGGSAAAQVGQSWLQRRGDRGGGNWQGQGQGQAQPNRGGDGRNNDHRSNGGDGRNNGQRSNGGDWRNNDHRNNGGDWRNNGQRGDWRGDRNRGGNWNRSWRQDNRYNWSDRRNRNRDAFHLPRYYAPYGWGYGYRRFGIGFELSSILYEQNYWIDDPSYYGLPEAYGPYRWVRYYNDALLVDIYSGQVVDTVYDIFW
ncbi:MAG: RcnB family protein [Sphingomonas bacterium]